MTPDQHNSLLPCPFCGYHCDACTNEEGEGYLGCANALCPASELAMTYEQWNTRAPSAELATLRAVVEKKDEALKHYTRLKSDTWRNAVDEYGEYWAFDWDGDLQDAPWEIAEKALALTPFEPVAKNEDGGNSREEQKGGEGV